MRRAFIITLTGCLLLAGCATGGGRKPPAATAQKSKAITPSPFTVIGHVLNVDASTGNVIIDVSPYTVLPLGFSDLIMITRTQDLRPTSKLHASPYLRGHILGAKLLAGRPNEGDEVVIPPATR
jgi:hypothetical protein